MDDLTEKALGAFAMASGLGIIPEADEEWDEDIANGMRAAIAIVLEEAAKVAEEYGEFDRKLFASAHYDEERAAFERGAFKAANIAIAIRALKSGK